jgi:YesN/AraC family two-component response regulator
MEDCEIVIITANSQFEYAKEAIKLKVEDFLVKPYSVKSFKETISKLIEKLKRTQLEKEEKKELENHFDKVKVIAEKDFVKFIDQIQRAKFASFEKMQLLK